VTAEIRNSARRPPCWPGERRCRLRAVDPGRALCAYSMQAAVQREVCRNLQGAPKVSRGEPHRHTGTQAQHRCAWGAAPSVPAVHRGPQGLPRETPFETGEAHPGPGVPAVYRRLGSSSQCFPCPVVPCRGCCCACTQCLSGCLCGWRLLLCLELEVGCDFAVVITCQLVCLRNTLVAPLPGRSPRRRRRCRDSSPPGPLAGTWTLQTLWRRTPGNAFHGEQKTSLLCCAVLCCAVLCCACAVLCCAVLCWRDAVQCCAV